MKSKKEQLLWQRLKRAKPPMVWVSRIENLVDDGMPDVWIAPRTWLELKVPSTIKRAIGANEIRPSQINWFAGAAATGTRAFLLAADQRAICLVPAEDLDSYRNATIIKARARWGQESMHAVWRVLLED